MTAHPDPVKLMADAVADLKKPAEEALKRVGVEKPFYPLGVPQPWTVFCPWGAVSRREGNHTRWFIGRISNDLLVSFGEDEVKELVEMLNAWQAQQGPTGATGTAEQMAAIKKEAK